MLVVIRFTYPVYRVYDLRETRICIISTVLKNKNNYPPTNTIYILQTVIFVHIN